MGCCKNLVVSRHVYGAGSVSMDLRPEVEALFANALDLSESEQEAFLARECSGDPVMRAEVETLLRNYRAAGTFLEPEAPGSLGGPASDQASHSQSGTPREFPATLDRYRIIRLLGEGGMGFGL